MEKEEEKVEVEKEEEMKEEVKVEEVKEEMKSLSGEICYEMIIQGSTSSSI